MPERKVWSVSELTAKIRDLLTRPFTDILVQGEVSNCRPAQSGHCYFTLKDDRAQIRCICFRNQMRLLKFRLEDGQQVTVRGSVSVYEARGDYQLYAETIEPAGVGALQLAFEQLKRKLEAEGIFSSAHKMPLPALPGRIGLITSPTGAAVRDVVRILRRRFPGVRLTVYPVRVQGEGSAGEIARAIRYFHATRCVDVLILARGGGSLEDLWAFNEEIVARAIFDCEIPIISGVGHETDFTIADFAADVRASTPSAAAEVVIQTRAELEKHIRDLHESLGGAVRYKLSEAFRRVHELAARRGFGRPRDLLRQRRQRADELHLQLARGLQAQLDRSRKRFGVAQRGAARFDFHRRIALFRKRIDGLAVRSARALSVRLDGARRRFSSAQLSVASFDLRARVAGFHLRVDRQRARLTRNFEKLLRGQRETLARMTVQLEERSPVRVLDRGYAIATDSAGRILRDASQVAIGDAIAVQLHAGRLISEVKKKES